MPDATGWVRGMISIFHTGAVTMDGHETRPMITKKAHGRQSVEPSVVFAAKLLLDEQHLPVGRQRPEVVGDHRLQLVAERRGRSSIAGRTVVARCTWRGRRRRRRRGGASALSSVGDRRLELVDRRRSASLSSSSLRRGCPRRPPWSASTACATSAWYRSAAGRIIVLAIMHHHVGLDRRPS